MSDLVTVIIDDVQYQVPAGRNMLDVCLSLKLDLPFFCWHPAMGSVGACRQCAVVQYRTDRAGREHEEIVMACMTEAADGVRVSLDHPEARRFRARMIELLMMSHPHDCPVCDEGGECHLQDMTVMTGHTYRRYRFTKRTHRNQDLGPFVAHEMNRCIACYRCVRFYRDYAGGTDFGVFSIRNQVYFGRKDDGALQSEFSGNLVEVCPTGVFTDKTLAARFTRKWDLQTAPSVCPHCGVGCSILPGERYGVLRRVLAGYDRHVNGHFICDRGRFGYEFVNAPTRLRVPLERVEGALRPVGVVDVEATMPKPPYLGQLDDAGPGWGGPPWQAAQDYGVVDEAAVDELVARTGRLLERGLSRGTVLGIGSPRASLEDNFALRELVGAEHFSLGMSESERALGDLAVALLARGPSPSADLESLQQADLVLVLGVDLTNEAPMLDLNVRTWLRLRPTPEEERLNISRWNDAAVGRLKEMEESALWLAHTHATKLDAVAASSVHATPEMLARFAATLLHAVDAAQPPVDGLPDALRAAAETFAAALCAARRPVVLTGTGCGSEALLRVAARLAWSLPRGERRGAPLAVVQPEADTVGSLLLGGRPLSEALYAMQVGEVDTAIVLQNDLVRRAGGAKVGAALRRCARVIALDHVANATTATADVVLPSATWAESTGTFVNFEGRARRFYRVFAPGQGVRPAWSWLRDLAGGRAGDGVPDWRTSDEVTAALAAAVPALAGVTRAAPPAGFRVAGQKIARKPQRYSGRTAVTAHLSVFEPRPPDDPGSPLAHSQEGYHGPGEGEPLVPRYWAPGWDSGNALHKFQREVNGPLLGGETGVRLIEPSAAAPPPEPLVLPREPDSGPGEWRVVPYRHALGSGELSALTPGIAERAPRPYVALNDEGARALGLHDGDAVDLTVDGVVRRVALKVDPSLPAGVAGMPFGLPESPAPLPPSVRLVAPPAKQEAGDA